MGESPRESELSDGSAREKILKAVFFQKLGEALQEKQWREAGAAVGTGRGNKGARGQRPPPSPGGATGHQTRSHARLPEGALCRCVQAGGCPLGVCGWGEPFQGWAPRQQWAWKSPGGSESGAQTRSEWGAEGSQEGLSLQELKDGHCRPQSPQSRLQTALGLVFPETKSFVHMFFSKVRAAVGQELTSSTHPGCNLPAPFGREEPCVRCWLSLHANIALVLHLPQRILQKQHSPPSIRGGLH